MSTSMDKPVAPADRGRLLLLLAGVVSVLMWYVPGLEYLVYPFKLFDTTIHEGCHAIVTILTGGVVRYINIHPDGSGVTMSGGGDTALITMAGYLGTAIIGAVVLQLIRRKGGGAIACLVFGCAMLGITLLWVRDLFGFVSGLLIAGSILACTRIPAPPVRDFMGSFLCVQLCLNALLDLRTLLLLTSTTDVPNDALLMAERVGLPPMFWAFLWAAAAVIILAFSLRTFGSSADRPGGRKRTASS